MTSNVPFLKREHIEFEANALLLAFGEEFEPVTDPPIPAEEILERHLRLTLDFDDLPKLLRVEADVFGATWMDRKQVIIDERLDPMDHPEMLGRFNFTVGHEIAHWQLHRQYFLRDPNQVPLFEVEEEPSIVCRTNEAREPIEWQADFFSSCLLMPHSMLEGSWRKRGNPVPVSLEDLKAEHRNRLAHSVPQNLKGRDSKKTDDVIIERYASPLAKLFAVSPIAMRIRLETLGFVVREEGRLFTNLQL